MDSSSVKHEIEGRLVQIERQISALQAEKYELKVQLADFESALASSRTSAAPETLTKWSNGDKFTVMDKDLASHAKRLFGISKFRPLQLPVMRAVLSGCDTVAVMPTGSGKSLLYQLPAVMLPGLTLVVSPLRSLMRDQVLQLQAAGVHAAFLAAGQERSHATAVYAAMLGKGGRASSGVGGVKRPRAGHSEVGAGEGVGPPPSPLPGQLKVLFVTPERIAKSKLLKSKLEAAHKSGLLSLLVVDEVHCVSQWGHDFRPDFKQLSVLKAQFPAVPCLGLTATASNKVLQDVQRMLQLTDCQVFRTSVRRPNLFLEVQPKANTASGVAEQLTSIVQQAQGGAGIVYCLSRKDAETCTAALLETGVAAGCYHAWLSDEQRESVHDAWAAGALQVICATVAFGMGINMLRVRFVVHHSLPKSVEGYSQEAGRAGRDGAPARCVLLYRASDVFRQSIMAYSEQGGLAKLYAMAAYAQAAPPRAKAPLAPSSSASTASAATSFTDLRAQHARRGRHALLASAFGEDPVRDCPFGNAGLDESGFPLWCGCDVLVAGTQDTTKTWHAVGVDASHFAAYLAVAVVCIAGKVEDWTCTSAAGVFCGGIEAIPSQLSSPEGASGYTLKQLLAEFHKWDRQQFRRGFHHHQLLQEWSKVTGEPLSPAVSAEKHKRIGQAIEQSAWEEIAVALLLQGVLKEAFSWTAYSTISYLAVGSRAKLKQLCAGKVAVRISVQQNPAESPTLFGQWCSQWSLRGGDSWADLQQATQAASQAEGTAAAAAPRDIADIAPLGNGVRTPGVLPTAAPRAAVVSPPGAPTAASRVSDVVELLSSDSEGDWA